jgi:hypothetical protein
MTFLDGNRVTPGTECCVCGPDCEFPCWQRVGLTTQPCCPGCPPLASDDVAPISRSGPPSRAPEAPADAAASAPDEPPAPQ